MILTYRAMYKGYLPNSPYTTKLQVVLLTPSIRLQN